MNTIKLKFSDKITISLSPMDRMMLGIDNGVETTNTLINNVYILIESYCLNINEGDSIKIYFNDFLDLYPYTLVVNGETHKLDEFVRIIMTMPSTRLIYNPFHKEYKTCYYVTQNCILEFREEASIIDFCGENIHFNKSIKFIIVGDDVINEYTWSI